MSANETVLCVSDDTDFLATLTSVLKSADIKVAAARSLREASELVAMTWPDIILLEALAVPGGRLTDLDFLVRHYRRRDDISQSSKIFSDRIIWFDRISDSGPELPAVPEPLPPRGPSPLVAHAEVPVPQEPTFLDLRGKPLPPDDVD